jgi:hypothetical protein
LRWCSIRQRKKRLKIHLRSTTFFPILSPMKASTLSILANFIKTHPAAWGTFEARAEGITFTNFDFVQDKGSWVLSDMDGHNHYFREYSGSIVAITSYTGNFVFVGKEAVMTC